MKDLTVDMLVQTLLKIQKQLESAALHIHADNPKAMGHINEAELLIRDVLDDEEDES